MSNVAKLKKRALDYEQKKQFDKALDTYVLVLAELDDHPDEADVALYNRVGDLLLRKGDVSEAVDHYEKAVDLYTDGGFFNNAIALCNKILRNAPGRNSVYYKLGKISAQKGFINDAKQNFLEYADRMQRGGQLEEAFRALKEFADLCPDQDDIRLMLADQLVRKDRKSEAIEQLQALYNKFSSEGRTTEARATVDRMQAIDAEFVPQEGLSNPVARSNDLVFLDVDYESGGAPKRPGTPGRATTPAQAPPAAAKGGAPVKAPATAKPAAAEKGAPVAAKPAAAKPAAAKQASAAPAPLEIISGVDLPLLDDSGGGTPAAGMVIPEHVPEAGLAGERADAAADITSRVDSAIITGFEETDFGSGARAPAGRPPISRLTGIERTGDELTLSESDADGDLPSLDLTDDLAVDDDAVMIDLEDVEPAAAARATSGLTLILPDDDLMAPAEDEPATPPAKSSGKAGAPITPARRVTPGGKPAAKGPAGKVAAGKTPVERSATVKARGTTATPVERTPAVKGRGTTATPVERTGAVKGGGKAAAPPEKGGRPPRRATPSTVTDLSGLEEEGATVIDAAFATGIETAVNELRERLAREPENWVLRREFGEALLENGERSAGLKALEEAMGGLERAGEFGSASSISDELLRVDPNSVRYHQKRVEYAVRSNDRPRLVDAYLALAECLFRSGHLGKSKAVYGRVLELAPDDPRAQSAMREAFGTREMAKITLLTPATGSSPAVTDRRTPAAPPSRQPTPATSLPADRSYEPSSDRRRGVAKSGSDRRRSEPPAPSGPPSVSEPTRRTPIPRRESFVNLADWLREEEPEKSTRMVSGDAETPREQVDFAEMLSMFKQGVAASVDDADHESHYDLGVAYKEMGLLDEAISEFQKALRGTELKVRTYEALGQCFVEKRQYQIALTILSRALNDRSYGDDMLVGVLYLLGYASESLGQLDEALKYYERVFAVDIRFRDIGDRLAAAEQKAR